MSDDADLLNRLLEVMAGAVDIARAAPPTDRREKGHQDHVTDVDLKLDAYLERALTQLTPDVQVLSEERPCTLEAPVERWWIVDPLDGTGNLVAGLPFVGIAVALIDRDGPLLSAVAAPFQGHIWSARRGHGAWLDGEPLSVPTISSQLVVVSSGLLDLLVEKRADEAWHAIREAGKVRNLGAQALHLCGVASGWFSAALSLEAAIWDEAAAGLILREAGGRWHSTADQANWQDPATMLTGQRQRSIACHPSVENVLLSPLRKLF